MQSWKWDLDFVRNLSHIIYIYMKYITISIYKVRIFRRAVLLGTDRFNPELAYLVGYNVHVHRCSLAQAVYSDIDQSGRSPKVVALFMLQTLVAIWYDFFQLHDTIKNKSNHTGINYDHNNIAIRNRIMIYNSVWKIIFATKFSSIYLAKGQKRLVFQPSFINLQRAKDSTHMFDAKYRHVFVV